MTLIGLIIGIVIIGLIVWLLSALPLPSPFGQIVYVLAVLVVIVMLLQFIGVLGSVRTF